MDLYSKFYAILWNYTPFFRVKFGIEVQDLRFRQRRRPVFCLYSFVFILLSLFFTLSLLSQKHRRIHAKNIV